MKYFILCCWLLLLSACASNHQPNGILRGQLNYAVAEDFQSDQLHIQIRLIELNTENKIQGIIAEQYINTLSVTPIEYSLYYDQNAIKSDATYAIEASLYVKGQLAMHTMSPQPLTIPFPSNTKVVLLPLRRP